MSFKISNIYKSLVAQIQNDLERVRADVSPQIQYHSWDTRGEEHELPDVDLCGIAGWTFEEDKGLWLIHCGITISTIQDSHLLREIDIIDILHDSWGCDEAIPMYDDAGNITTYLHVNEFQMLAAGTSEKRNYRPLGIELLRTSGE